MVDISIAKKKKIKISLCLFHQKLNLLVSELVASTKVIGYKKNYCIKGPFSVVNCGLYFHNFKHQNIIKSKRFLLLLKICAKNIRDIYSYNLISNVFFFIPCTKACTYNQFLQMKFVNSKLK